jgi:hypothetical protein
LIGGCATFDGDVYDRSNGMVLAIDQGVITGSIFHNQDARLDNDVDEVLAASAYASSLMPNRSNASVKIRGYHNITITGAPGETIVLSLKNFILKGNSSFTLQGTATTTFIRNSRLKAIRILTWLGCNGTRFCSMLLEPAAGYRSEAIPFLMVF